MFRACLRCLQRCRRKVTMSKSVSGVRCRVTWVWERCGTPSDGWVGGPRNGSSGLMCGVLGGRGAVYRPSDAWRPTCFGTKTERT
eukprot:4903196-Alexandrium_andersonii.AAC.1